MARSMALDPVPATPTPTPPAPEYAIVDKSGPGHAPRFTVRVTIGKLAAAEATGTSKQEAETLAAKALLAQLGG